MTKLNIFTYLFVSGLSFQVFAQAENPNNLTTVLPQKVVIQQEEVALPGEEAASNLPAPKVKKIEVVGETVIQKVEVTQPTQKLEVTQGASKVDGPAAEAITQKVEVKQEVVVEKPVETKAVIVEQKVESTKVESTGTSGGSVVVEKAAAPEIVTSNKLIARPVESRKPEVALSIHYSTIGRFLVTDGTQTVGTTKTTGYAGDFNARTTMGFALSAWNTKRHSWGYMGGISFDGPREMSPLHWTSTVSGPAIFSGGMGSTMFLALLEGNAVYRIEDVYFLSGLNASIPGYKKAHAEPGTTTLRGGLGLQFGIGAFANEAVSFEAMYKVISIGVNYKDPSVEFDSNSVISDGFQFQTKFTF